MQTPYTIDQLKSKLIPVFRNNHVRKATLFGSYSKGCATKKSDVDLYVDCDFHGMRFFGLLEDVCTSLECEVHLIHKDDVIPNSLINHEIRNTGVVIYKLDESDEPEETSKPE